jgi:formylglycine-generating enzyme required for sulfatase activity
MLLIAFAPCLAAQESLVDSIPGTLVRFEMVPIPGQPGHWVGRTEVTWDMYDAFALSVPDSVERRPERDATARPTRPYGAPDYGWGHAGFPVISVAFTAAEAFCAWLSARMGKKYRLPTEAEWDRLAALATRATMPSGPRLDAVAWHQGNSGGRTHRVGEKEPDALGLHDLFGNAAEWVVTSAGRPVVRGGSFRDPVARVGPSARTVQDDTWNERDPQIPQSRWWLSDAPFVGFRIVREP